MANLADQVAQRVRDLRAARGWSQEQLAEAAGLSRDAVSRIERADRSPRLDTLAAIGGAVGVSLPEVLDFARRPAAGPRRNARAEVLARALENAEPWLADALVAAVRGIAAAGTRARRRPARR